MYQSERFPLKDISTEQIVKASWAQKQGDKPALKM